MATPAALRSALPGGGKRGSKPQPTQAQLDAVAAQPKFVHEVPRGHAGAKVTVACKLPNGVVLKVHRQQDVDVPVMTGGVRTVKEFRPDLDVVPVTVHGWRSAPDGILVIKSGGPNGGYALTPNVPKDLWDRWREENKASLLVTNNLVFAFESADHAQGQAKEMKAVRSGLEPMNPAMTTKIVDGESRTVPVDPRWPRRQNGTPAVETIRKDDA